MKRLFSLFSMLMLLSSNALPVFTYAESGANELAIQILTEEVNNVGELFNNENNIELVQGNDNMSAFSTDSDNPHIVYDEENGLITVYTGDFSYGITIKDKNLGSEVSGTGTESIGNYYRWGYNTPITSTNNSSTSNNDAWGGGDDVLEKDGENENIIKGYNKILHKSTNLENRRGPCPENYHIASAGERNELIKLYYNAKGLKNLIEEKTYSLEQWSVVVKSDSEKNFVNDLKFPFPGSRYHNGNVIFTEGSNGGYWTSSPVGGSYTSHARYFYATQNGRLNVTTDYDIRSFTFPIRCFKNDYVRYPKTITYNPNGGAFPGMDVNEIKEYTYNYSGTEIIPIYNIQIPDRETDDMSQQSGWMFAGWYTTATDQTTEFDPTTSTTNVAYAKWLPFNDLDLSVIGLTGVKIMDRNMGAEGYLNEDGKTEEQQYGYYYQRGNNYGFKSDTINTINEKISNKNHNTNPRGPNNPVYYNKFVTLRSTYNDSIDKERNGNLWGGLNSDNPDSFKRGPCPEGYHIPRVGERVALNHFFENKIDNNKNFCNVSMGKGDCLNEKLLFPLGGELNGEDGNHKRPYATYRSSTREYDNGTSNVFSAHGNTVAPEGNRINIEGIPVRCLKNSNKDIILGYEINGEITKQYNFRWRDSVTKAYKEESPILENAKFVGWYNKKSHNKFEFNEFTHIAEDTVLVPEYECVSGYTKSADGKSCELIKLTFNADGGKFKNGNQEKNLNITINLIEKLIRKISHTPNFTDDGEFLETEIEGSLFGAYGGKQFLFYAPEYREITKIEGAKNIEVNIKYAGSSCGWSNGLSTKYIWTGEQLDYNMNDSLKAVLLINNAPNTQGEIGEISQILSGDSITIYRQSGCYEYGRYATINGTGIIRELSYDINYLNNLEEPKLTGYIFDGWYYDSGTYSKRLDITNISTGESLNVYAKWKSLEEKVEETTKNVVYTNNTTVTINEDPIEKNINDFTNIELVSKEVESHEVSTEEDTTKVQDSEIKVTSDKTVEYEGGLEVYLEKTENSETEKLTGTIKFSEPVAVKIPVSSDVEYVKVQVKHGDEDFGFKGLTLNPVNECNNGEVVNVKYNGEDVEVKNNNGDKYATIYTCSASTFVAYTENLKPVIPQPSAGGGRIITTTKQETKVVEQEHNSSDTVESEIMTQTSEQSTNTAIVKDQVKKIEGRELTRGEVAIMTNVLLEVYPQLIEGKQELDDVTNACSNYADEQNFTKDERKAITRLCKLSIMGIHNDINEPLEEFLVNNKSTNDEFSKVINRSIESYNEKDLSTIKDALKKLEGDEEKVVFGTVYDMFMGIKKIFS